MKKTKETKEYTGEIPNTPFRFLLYASKPFKWWAFLAIAIVVTVSIADTLLVLILKKIITAAESGDIQTVVFFGLMYPVAIFATSTLWRASGLVGRLWAVGVEKKTTDTLVSYSVQHSHSYFANRFAGSLVSKAGNVSGAIQRLVIDLLWHHLEAGVALITAGVVILTIDTTTGMYFFGLVITLVILNYFLVPRKRAFSLALSESKTRARGSVVDVFSNISATRQYTRMQNEKEFIQEQTKDIRDRGAMSWLYSEYMMFVNGLVLTIYSFAMFYMLLVRWIDGDVTTSGFIAVMILIMNLAGTMIFIGRTFNDTAAAYGEAEEGLSELVIPHEIVDKQDATEITVNGGQIDWKDVTFEFGNNTVFDNFDLTIRKGQRVGLVGPSGAGKTTFVSLLLRQHDIDDGAIEIDGHNIAQVTQDSLRANIAVVPQEPLLFHRTIKENIAYGNPDATQEEIEEVAKKAQAHEFIMKLEDGYDTMVGERGIKLSGGQKQRVAIARAMLKDTPILVLDEATSALDSESEVAIQKALQELMEGKTVIAVAHRLSTLREMDRILVLETGKVIEDGTHDELTKNGGTYQRLWEHQAGGFLTE